MLSSANLCSLSAEIRLDSERVNHLPPTVTLSSLNFSLEHTSPCEIIESKHRIVCPLNTELQISFYTKVAQPVEFK